MKSKILLRQSSQKSKNLTTSAVVGVLTAATMGVSAAGAAPCGAHAPCAAHKAPCSAHHGSPCAGHSPCAATDAEAEMQAEGDAGAEIEAPCAANDSKRWWE